MSIGRRLLDTGLESVPAVVARDHEAERSRAGFVPWFAAIACTSGLGLLGIALSFSASRAGNPGLEPLFWLGYLAILLPIGLRLLARGVPRPERLGLIMLAVLVLYLVKVLHDPYGFTYSDEYLHAYNTQRILDTGRLFNPNTILAASPLFPGLPLIVSAGSSVSGLSVFWVGVIVIGLARLVLGLSLFLLMEQVAGSPRVAGLAAFVYMAHSNYLLWSAQFSYESLALPLAVLAVYLVKRRESSRTTGARTGLTFAALLVICSVVVVHHLTSYLLAGAFLVWALLFHNLHRTIGQMGEVVLGWYGGESSTKQVLNDLVFLMKRIRNQVTTREIETRSTRRLPTVLSPGGFGFLVIIAATAWLGYVAFQTVGYLSAIFGSAGRSIIGMIAGDVVGRQLFQSTSGEVAPLWERLSGFGSVLVCLMAYPFGMRIVWQRYRHNSLAVLLTLAATLYFAMFALRFSPAAWETANRASAFLFLGLAFVLGLALVWLSDVRNVRGGIHLMITAGVAVLFIGGFISGWSSKLRLALPYLVQSQGHLTRPAGVEAAEWMLRTLGPGNVIAADESNARNMLWYGRQLPYAGRFPDIKGLLEADVVTPSYVETLRRLGIRYLLIDRRQISWDNMSGYFFDRAPDGQLPEEALFDAQRYLKLDDLPQASRVFDGGEILIYDLKALIDARSIP